MSKRVRRRKRAKIKRVSSKTVKQHREQRAKEHNLTEQEKVRKDGAVEEQGLK